MIHSGHMKVHILYKHDETTFSDILQGTFQYGQRFESSLESVSWIESARFSQHCQECKTVHNFQVSHAELVAKDAAHVLNEIIVPDRANLCAHHAGLAEACGIQSRIFQDIARFAQEHPNVRFLLVNTQQIPDSDAIPAAEREARK